MGSKIKKRLGAWRKPNKSYNRKRARKKNLCKEEGKEKEVGSSAKKKILYCEKKYVVATYLFVI